MVSFLLFFYISPSPLMLKIGAIIDKDSATHHQIALCQIPILIMYQADCFQFR